MFVCYTEFAKRGRVRCHYALILAAAQHVDMATFGQGDTYDEGKGVVLLLVSIPLTFNVSPQLPNPVRPDLNNELNTESEFSEGETISLLDSFGVGRDFLLGLEGKVAIMYPRAEGSVDYLNATLSSAFIQIGVAPLSKGHPDTFVIFNAKLANCLRSTRLRDLLSRRTKLYTTGGLVTFSPTFILRSPERFGEIMKLIRASDTWAAYVLPSVIEWASLSLAQPARCPDPVQAFEVLTRSLFLDRHLLQFSGSAVSSGGGLAVSCAPPAVHSTEACASWTEWLHRAFEQNDFQSLVDICTEVRSTSFGKGALANQRDGKADVEARSVTPDLVDIETSQIEDLIAMRMRPYLLPYRRYIYIGDVSLDQRACDGFGAAIEFLPPDRFEDVFSDAV
ncbi:MAG: hypothetical protein TREMPRED_005059 [Tremellales sp. Tagirdzhanova-0007]|nr:MAG: hypothetical protein TREMPRED_005059 [Tremellales sp. Tagirdzhanova-0007]